MFFRTSLPGQQTTMFLLTASGHERCQVQESRARNQTTHIIMLYKGACLGNSYILRVSIGD